jgi:hypothetical protein
MMLRTKILKSTKSIGSDLSLFLSSRATDRNWLQNDDEKGMTCKICVEHYRDTLNLQRSSKKHLFIAYSKNYKISTVSDHEKSCVILMQLE